MHLTGRGCVHRGRKKGWARMDESHDTSSAWERSGRGWTGQWTRMGETRDGQQEWTGRMECQELKVKATRGAHVGSKANSPVKCRH